MLVAFSVLLLLLTHTLPLYIHVKQERKNIEMDKAAVRLLHQTMLEYKYDGALPDSFTQIQGRVTYHIDWHKELTPFFKACISWEDLNKRHQKRCDHIKR
jgi:competence protein ComGE